MMAHGTGSASRHGRYDAFRTDFSTENAADELPSQSVFSYEGTEDVRRARENPTISRFQASHHTLGMSHSVVPPGPLVAVHMFDVGSDKYLDLHPGKRSDSSESSQTQTSQLRRWSREALHATDGIPPASPQPPSTPRSSRPGSMRRSRSGQRPPSSQRPSSNKSQRPQSTRRSSKDCSFDQEEVLPPMTSLRPQSSIGKYHVLPAISKPSSPNHQQDSLYVDIPSSYRSDGSDDQRGVEAETDYLTSKLAHQALVETSRRNSREGSFEDGYTDWASSTERQKRSVDTATAVQDMRQNSTDDRLILPEKSSRKDSVTSAASRATPVDESHHHWSSACSNVSNASSQDPLSSERSYTSIGQYGMDEELPTSLQGSSAEDQVLLGIKIPPEGTRHKQYFHRRDQLRCIMLFAEEVSGKDFSNHVLVLATTHRRFNNLSQTIESAGLETKSVVHLEELD